MLTIFESILPIFLLVLMGVWLKRLPMIDKSFWMGLEQFSYYVLFPALLFLTMMRADFSDTESLEVSGVAIMSVCVMATFMLCLWPLLRNAGVKGPAFTSLFQTTTRWNGFMALAIAAKTYDQQGLTVVGLVMAAIIIPLNIANIGVLVWFSGGERGYRMLIRRIVTNPLIFFTLLGIVINLAGIPIYQPVVDTIDLLSKASLSLGLITVGAGLRIMDALKPKPLVLLAVFMKLIAFPILAVSLGLILGVDGNGLVLLALCACVPTAMNGYVLAKQMNGDADFYAAAATVQTAVAFFSIPAVMSVAAYVAAG